MRPLHLFLTVFLPAWCYAVLRYVLAGLSLTLSLRTKPAAARSASLDGASAPETALSTSSTA